MSSVAKKTVAKTTTTKTASVTPSKETVAAAAPATTSRSKASAPAAAPAAAAVAAPVVAAAPAATATTTEGETEPSLVAEFNTQVTKINELRNSLGVVLADMKKLEKRVAREMKKAGRRRRARAPLLDEAGNPVPKKPSVFTKPQKITDALCVFLGKAKGTEMSRSDVTRGIMEYVKKNSLNNKQDINPDAALRKLLSVSETEKVTILNLQRFLKTHYIKAPVVVA
jgi:chromatin remodeling complex protein RSC6